MPLEVYTAFLSAAQALHVKTASSAALPIYQTLPEQPQRIEIAKQAAEASA